MLPVQSWSKGSDEEIRCSLRVGRGGGGEVGLGTGSLQPCPQLCNDAGCRSTSVERRAPLFSTHQSRRISSTDPHWGRFVQTAVMLLHAYRIYLHYVGPMWIHACLPTLTG